uniref:Aquaporin n=1 Tax=Panagrolaimus superbus TaxID=310955 RepID=A0A914YH16_9BILA
MLIGMAWGMNSGYSLNPARDFGPRIFTYFAGYGLKVFSYRNHKWFLVPLISPFLGGPLGAWLYQFSVGFHIPSELDEIEEECKMLQKSN